MCGIAGYIAVSVPGDRNRVIECMITALRHRGPDDSGFWQDDNAGVFLGHRRLSIVDLSEAGHQPMMSASGRYSIVYNGEIYNHLELRRLLDDEGTRRGCKMSWRGHSDTEVFLAAVESWGIQRAIESCVGMFAIAIWDRMDRVLTLARDRLGEKPLYYGWVNGSFLFGSELKAFQAFPGFASPMDADALGLYSAFGYIPAPWSIYKDVRKLEPGHILILAAPDGPKPASLSTKPYWELQNTLDWPRFGGSEQDAVGELDRLLSQAIRLQKVADVPVGCFLSGGVDSSAIAAVMQEQSSDRIRTFSIGFEEKKYDETPYAEAVARHLGTDHTSLLMSASQLLDLVPAIPRIWDEPFADSSQLPTALVAQLARQSVTVSLSGDGGDELFAGYDRYDSSRRAEWIPAKKIAANIVSAMPELSTIPLRILNGMSGTIESDRVLRRRLNNLAEVLRADSPVDRYLIRMSKWGDINEIVPAAMISPADVTNCRPKRGTDYVTALTLTDMASYLPGDILTKVDRAAMAVSLETRVPLLDHRIVQFAFSLPVSMKICNGQTKWPLRQVLERRVPRALFERPKKGFSIPLDRWLRGPLRDWAESLLAAPSLEAGGLNPEPILQFWQEHVAGSRSWGRQLWPVLTYQAWRAEYHS
jgi:asparagine synthase (glutamine-hydrolysing)